MGEEGSGIVGGDALHGFEIGIDAGLLEAGLGEILRGTNEDAGAALNGGAKGGKIATGFWREEKDGLLGLGGNGNGDAFFADFFVPGFDAGEPLVGWRVGGAAEKGGDEEVMDGLGGGEGRDGARAGRRVEDWGRGRWGARRRRG